MDWWTVIAENTGWGHRVSWCLIWQAQGVISEHAGRISDENSYQWFSICTSELQGTCPFKKPILGLQAISELKIKFLEVSEKNLCKHYSMMQLISLFYSRKLFGMAGRSHAGIAGSNPSWEHGCVSVVWYQVEVSAIGRSSFQNTHIVCCVPFFVIYKLQQRGGPGPRWAVSPKENRKCWEHI